MQKQKTSFILTTLLLIFLSGCGTMTDSERINTGAVEESIGQEEQPSSETLPGDAADSKESLTEKPHTTGKKGDLWILPEARTHIYTKKELSGLTREELRLARNEIYARHGRKFRAADLNDYFSLKEWYNPTVEADAFDEKTLNQEETGNLKLIQQMEEAFGLEVITCPKIGVGEFPALDGSTATIPISKAIFRLSTGASEQEADSFIKHGKTTNAYLNLIEDRGPGLVIAYAPGETVEESLAEHGDNLIIKPIGRDALVFMKNAGNPVGSLSRKQVRDIYSGKLTNWKELGGRNQIIKAFQRPENSGSQNLMMQLAMKGTPMTEAPAEYVASEMGELLERVSAYDNTAEALGYSVYYYARNMYQMPGLRFMSIDGTEPSEETIRDGSYPYVSDFYAAVRKDEPEDSNAYRLFEWLTTDDGQALLNGLGYVGIGDTEKAFPDILDEDEESFTAEIPLAAGTVILGDGRSLYGESGFGEFDKNMKLLKFHRYLAPAYLSQFKECAADSVMAMQDTRTAKYGVYSLKEDRFICGPDYDYAFETRDGFGLETSFWDEENEKWNFTYDFIDREGKIIRAGVDGDSTNLEELLQDSEKGNYHNQQEFAELYPDILKRHGIRKEDIIIAYIDNSADIFALIGTEKETHYYNMNGELQFSFDKNLHENNFYERPFLISDRMAGITVYTGEPHKTYTYIYRDQKLIKTLVSGDAEGWTAYIGENFYTRYHGNYLYVYNYKDQPCAKFLEGYSKDD